MQTEKPSEVKGDIVCACTNLRIATRATGRLYDKALAPLDINSVQFSIINNIGKRGSVASMILVNLLSMERTTLYRALAILERRSLIKILPSNGREKILSLTVQGESLRQQALALWAKTQDDFVKRFGDDWEIFLSMLTKTRDIVDELEG